MNAPRQNIGNLKGEIAFREKLARQHTTGELLLPDYFDKDSHDLIMAERIATTRETFSALKEKGVNFSQFLELGAERGHRSLSIVNSFHATGFAMDISFAQLRTADHFSRIFHLPRVPHRVCCDANNLPLKNEVVPFLFCYQFLHHFPSLKPVLGEIHRVMSGSSSFFFDEEPMGRLLQLHLYKQKAKEYSRSNLRKGKLLRWLEGLVSETESDEVQHGVIENHAMKMPEWQDGLSIFDAMDVRVRTLRHLKSRISKSMRLANFPNHLLGGVIQGVCQKAGAESPSSNIFDWLACPDCRVPAPSGDEWNHPPLDRKDDVLVCQYRGCRYPIIEDIPILIPKDLRKELYPAFS